MLNSELFFQCLGCGTLYRESFVSSAFRYAPSPDRVFASKLSLECIKLKIPYRGLLVNNSAPVASFPQPPDLHPCTRSNLQVTHIKPLTPALGRRLSAQFLDLSNFARALPSVFLYTSQLANSPARLFVLSSRKFSKPTLVESTLPLPYYALLAAAHVVIT